MSSLSIALYFPFTRVKVVGQNVHPTGAVIRMEQDRRWRPLCHDCRCPAQTVHSQGHRRMIRDLNLADRQVWLDVDYRKVWCPCCGRAQDRRICQARSRALAPDGYRPGPLALGRRGQASLPHSIPA